MKKIFVIILIGFCFAFVAGCVGVDSMVLNNMSDIRFNFFEGKNDNIHITLSCGYREEIFAYDGQSTNPLECGVLAVGYFEFCSYSSIVVILGVDGVESEYVLEKSPYEELYMEDIGKILTSENNVYIRLKNQKEKIELYEMSGEWTVDYKKAINIASSHFNEDLKDLYFNGKFNAECYLKVVSKIDFDDKFWYFSFIDRAGNSKSCLIDIYGGEIISGTVQDK